MLTQIVSLLGSLSWALVPVDAPTELVYEFYPPIVPASTSGEKVQNYAKWHRSPRDGLTILPYAFT